jgi:glucan phosphoethanolaminetransferase (alkaline phosphatase superfamily)
VYLILDALTCRFHDWNRSQWLYYAFSLMGSQVIWLMLRGLIARVALFLPKTSRGIAVVAGMVYGLNVVLVYGYRLLVGVMPDYHSFQFVSEAPLNTWVLLHASLRPIHVVLIVLASATFTLLLLRKPRMTRIKIIAPMRVPWSVGTVVGLFLVLILARQGNVRSMDRYAAVDVATVGSIVNATSVRMSQEKSGTAGLGPRTPMPLPPLADGGPRTRDGRPLNVLIILNESLRADELSLYGYARATSPFLDSLVSASHRAAFRFNTAYSQASRTFLSLPSLVSGVSPVSPERLFHAQPVFWEYFRAMKRQTFFITGQSHDWYNLKAYFEASAIEHMFNRELSGLNPDNDLGIDDAYTVDHFVDWLRHRDTTRAFAGLLQFNQTHYPYWTPEDQQPFGADTPRDKYDNAIRYTDAQLRRVVEALDDAGLREQTLLVIASDHGEEFMEHGRLGHTETLHREVLQVPMVWILPRPLVEDAALEPKLAVLSANTVQHVANLDILPTLLDLCQVWNDTALTGIRSGFEGQSLLEPVTPDRCIISSNMTEVSGVQVGLSLILGDWHYILNLIDNPEPMEELYSWGDDPTERSNRFAQIDPVIRSRVYSVLAQFPFCRQLYSSFGTDLVLPKRATGTAATAAPNPIAPAGEGGAEPQSRKKRIPCPR